MGVIEAVLWDMDGVILDSERLVCDVFVEFMTIEGLLENPRDLYLQTIGLNRESTINLYSEVFGSRKKAEQLWFQVSKEYQSRISTDLTLKHGAKAALEFLADLGLPQMVVTSTRRDAAIEKLDRFSLMSYFDDLVGGDQVSKGKPNPEGYLMACEKLSFKPQNALVIEDSENGVRAGLAAGCKVLHVPDLVVLDNGLLREVTARLDSLEVFPSWMSDRCGL